MAQPSPIPLLCVCRHSLSAHRVGAERACSFCSCAEFRDPNEMRDEQRPLSDQAQRAITVMSRHRQFRRVPRESLEDIARYGTKRLFMQGQLLMEQGEPSDNLFIIVRGAVKVFRHIDGMVQPMQLAELQEGDIVGEMGVLNGEPRTATVIAAEDLDTLQIASAPLKRLFQREPDVLIAIMRLVMERLKSTDEQVELSLKIALAQLSTPVEEVAAGKAQEKPTI